jgi:enoyl-CoA hydratase
MNEPLLFDRQGHVAILTLNRPERRNAISPELACRMADALTEIACDDAIRCVVLTGEGDAAFCSGGDLELSLPLLSGDRAAKTEWDHRFLNNPDINDKLTLRNFALNKPIVTAVNGVCMAGGMEILLATDIRLAVPTAKFALPEACRGVIPFAGALARLPRQIPYAVAMEMLTTGVAIDAETALRHGLINRIVEQGDLLDQALAMAERVAANAPVSVQRIKSVVTHAMGRTLDQGFALEDAAKADVMQTQDAREGPRAFMEKRAPKYQGR